MLKSGGISESGNYEELMNRKGAFADFLIAHLQEINPEEEDLDELKNQLENTNPELVDKLEQVLRRRESTGDSDNNSSTLSMSRQTSVDSAGAELRQRSISKQSSTVELKQKTPEPAEKNKLIEQEKAEEGSVKWDVYKHYLKSIGVMLSVLTIIFNVIFQGFAIGSNIWLSRWSVDKSAGTDTGVRDMYLGVYGAFGLCQGKLFLGSM